MGKDENAGSCIGRLVWGGGLAGSRVNAGSRVGKHRIFSTASLMMALFKPGTRTINNC